jgi:hypothetical protein
MPTTRASAAAFGAAIEETWPKARSLGLYPRFLDGDALSPSSRIQSSGHLLRVRWRPCPCVAARVATPICPPEAIDRPHRPRENNAIAHGNACAGASSRHFRHRRQDPSVGAMIVMEATSAAVPRSR